MISAKEETKHNVPQQITNNYSSLYRLAGDLLGCERGQYEDISWVNNNHTWPSRVYGINLSEENINQKLEWVIEGMKSGRMPKVIGTSQFTRPENYEQYFSTHGLVKVNDAEGMALNVANLKMDYESKIVVEVKKVTDVKMLYDFAKIVTLNLFQLELSDVDAYYNCIEKLMLTGAADFFLAYQENEAIATAMVYYSEDEAGLYHIATVEAYRGLGVGKQVTITAILQAITMGHETVVLFATESGKYIYNQLGFKTVCKLGRYKLKV